LRADPTDFPYFNGRSGRFAKCQYQPDDTLNVIDLLLVTDLEIKPTANGAGKRRKT
jgi:hypothetical protein